MSKPWSRALVAMLAPLGVGMFLLGRWSAPAPAIRPAGPAAAVAAQAPPPVVAAPPEVEQDPTDRSSWPPQLVTAEKFLRKYANDPKSLEIVEWKEPVRYDGRQENPPKDATMLVTIRERNNLGAMIVGSVLVYFDGGKVIHLTTQSDMTIFNYEVAQAYRQQVANPLGQALGDLANPPPGRRATPKR